MNINLHPFKRSAGFVILAGLLLAAIAVGPLFWQGGPAWQEAEGFKTKAGRSAPVVIQSTAYEPVVVPPAAGFTGQTRLGFTSGDQWEPAIASDRFGHVYVLYPQYYGVPGCSTCASPNMVLQISSDEGVTWGTPAPISASSGAQWDPQIVIDPVDGRTVYAVWMQNNKSDIVVAKSTNFGATWTQVVADNTNAATDKPILTVRGQDVYVAYNHAQKVWVASSHDGGQTFVEVNINPNGRLGWSLAGGGAVTPNGHVYFSWAGYKQNGGAKGDVNLYISRSTDGGLTWVNNVLDVSGAPPVCPDYACGWAYLGAQAVMTSDSAGNLYALWNANSADKAPNRLYFAKSADGITWSAKVDVSTAANGKHHNFPAIVAGDSGEVHISWMDTRAASGGAIDRWNAYYRHSTNGGTSWSTETDISTYVAGYSYIFTDGFRFPFGDYYEIDLDEEDQIHVIMGEGFSYDSPGSIWYTRGP